MNRFFRRMQRFGRGRAAQAPGEDPSEKPPDLAQPGTSQDVSSVRAKASGHRKKTADKWNQ